MSKRTKIVIALLIALSSFTAIVVLANEVANTLYLPILYQNYSVKPTATPTPKVAITGFHPSYNPQVDYVMLKNTTSGTLDLTGWWMKAESESGRYDFPAGYLLGAGKTVNVVSGVGTDSAANLYIGLPYSLWTSQNNCAYLR